MRVLIIKDQLRHVIEQTTRFFSKKEYLNLSAILLITASVVIPIVVYKLLSTFKKTRKSRFFSIHNQTTFKSFISLFFRKISRLWFVAISFLAGSYLFWQSVLNLTAKPLFNLSVLFFISALFIQIYRMYNFEISEHRLRSKLKATLIFIYFFTLGSLLFNTHSNKYITLLLFATIIMLSALWRKQITDSLGGLAYIGKYFTNFFESKWSLITLPFLMPLALSKHLFYKFSSIFSKQKLYIKIVNQIMKSKLSEVYQGDEKFVAVIPSTYQFLFDDQSLSEKRFYLPFPENHLGKIEDQLIQWRNSKTSEQSLAIIGKKGSGKTTFLKAVLRSTRLSSFQKIYYSFEKKMTLPRDVNSLIAKLFDKDFDGGIESMIELDKSLSPTLIILDNFHNAFLSQEDGLEAMKYFIRLINSETKNIFWVASFDHYSWSFLSNIIGQKYFFRKQANMPKWDTALIRKMIKIRHGISGYSLNFDLIREVLNNTQESKITDTESEQRFFNLLAHQSGHIPGLALSYWINAVRIESYKKIGVLLPPEELINIDGAQLEDSSLFVYAAVLRHVTLDFKQVTSVTSLPKGLVANALKLGIERGLLERNVRGQYKTIALRRKSLISFLSKKNFIYE